MSRILRAAVATFALLLSLLVMPALAGATPAPAPGNSPNAKACQKGGYATLVRSDGSAFATEAACTSYAATGGTLQPKATLTASRDSNNVLTVTGAGLLPYSIVYYDLISAGGFPEHSVLGIVASDGTFSYVAPTGCGYTQFTASATTASGATITTIPPINAVPCS